MKPYYDHAGITIYHGDCRNVLPLPVSVDLLLTDPPYGVAHSQFGKAAESNIAADGVRQGVRVVRQGLFEAAPLLADDAHLLMFCHWQSFPDFYDALSGYVRLRNALVWNKGGGGTGDVRANYIRDYELILFGANGRREVDATGFSAVLDGFTKPSNALRLHPTEKPVELLSELIRRHCPKGGLVLDPFVGSGPTLRAAQLESRKAIGIEIEERYCEIAATRLGQGILDFGEAA